MSMFVVIINISFLFFALILLALMASSSSSSFAIAQQPFTTTSTNTTSAPVPPSPADDDDTEDPWQKTEAYREILVVTAVLCGVSIITMVVLVLTKLAIEGNKGGFKSKQTYRRDAHMADNDYVAYVETSDGNNNTNNNNDNNASQQEQEEARMTPREI